MYSAILAALLFSTSGYFMKTSEGMTQFMPTVGFILLLLLGAMVQTVALKGTELSVMYVVMLGIEAVVSVFLGIVLMGEQTSALKFGSTALIVAGIVALQLSD